MKIRIFATLALAVMLSGCASQSYVVHPGAANTFDSQSYDALIVAHAAIEQAKLEYGNGALPASAKTEINDAVTAYNVADSAYLVYHTAALAGNATAAQQASLQAQLATLNSSIAVLSTAPPNPQQPVVN